MSGLLKWTGRLLALLVLLFGLAWLVLPREPVDRVIDFDPSTIGTDVDAYLARTEARFDDITPGVEKRVIWAGRRGTNTPFSVLYVHGFSATSQEIRPVPDEVADALGANLVFTRLRGHGRDGAALATATAGDWIEDMAEAMEIARRVGERVIVISASTGGTLAAIAATDPDLGAKTAGYVFISPNFRIVNPAATFLTWPAARWWLPRVVGEERSFQVLNADHGRYWTTSYPTVAVLPMAALVRHANRQNFGTVKAPALFMFSDQDMVVSADATREVAQDWGGRVTLAPQELVSGSDPYNHVLAGDILSPAMTDVVVARILDWTRGLER